MNHMITHLKKYKRSLSVIVLLTILQITAGLLTPTILSTLVSEGILKQDNQQITTQGLLILAMSK
ncbi:MULTISPECIES: hypothetical protein [unclassified Granulicatella]|uniref:hypothetical protein n=1 Tax=unclassified Granulicatella TaxID=2630493 RepID=UPI00107368BD|nr:MULTISPECIES: hypothetical protein [unclassified Granulicatella]MBF0779967.1 hypothetical protein [Granulicatella sp. 19428wC4_WM01]TFU95983.1 hypothetical protein E4T68_02545 [Granulicatella sp. WM01]